MKTLLKEMIIHQDTAETVIAQTKIICTSQVSKITDKLLEWDLIDVEETMICYFHQ